MIKRPVEFALIYCAPKVERLEGKATNPSIAVHAPIISGIFNSNTPMNFLRLKQSCY
jgi:hypothetical protein